MEKQYLLELKRKISELSVDDLKKRDLYLKGLVNGDIQGPNIGFPTIDKPWLKYIDVNTLYKPREKCTVYEELCLVNKNNMERTAIEYFGAKISYKKLFSNIENCAKSLVKMGIKENDFVTICSVGTPELVYLFYAISKIGAVANFIPPYFTVDNTVNRINDCNSKYIFVTDNFYDIIKESIEKSSLSKTIIMPLFNSSPLRFIKKTKKVENVEYWNNFIETAKNDNFVETVGYVEDKPLTLIYSSGSTGDAKSILLTNDSFEESIHSYDACGINLDGRQKYYQIIPPWFSTGLSTSIHLPLSKGATVFMDPRIDKKVFVDNIIKHKINATVATATMYDGFVESNLKKNVDLSYFTNGFEGGEPLKKERKENIERVLHEHGCEKNLKIGYGQCESGAGITTQTDDFYRSDESVGIPIPGAIVGIFDENFDELPYNQRGQILAKTKCAMKEYYKNEKATNEYFYTDEFGQRWSCTGDLGCIDEEGMIYVYGRQSDFTIINDEKIYNFEIEKTILNNSDIINCAVVSSKNDEGIDEIAAHIIFSPRISKELLSDEQFVNATLKQLQAQIYEKFNSVNYVPCKFKIRETIPTSRSSKRDTKTLREEVDGFIYLKDLDFQEKVLTKSNRKR